MWVIWRSLPRRRLLRSRHRLADSPDEHLIEQLRRGNEVAFEVMFERYAPAITSFCRHMVGSSEEAEEAVQHTFAAAYRSLLRDDRDMALKPWLYKIARNHCISILRERPDLVSATPDAVTGGLAEHVERRADVRALLRDLAELPHEQREALLLTEVSGLSHQEVGRVLGCPARRVKGLVFRARRNLMEWRDARETPCDRIREQLVTLRGTELRRNELRHHLRVCQGCREFLAEVRHQRTLLEIALPVAPSVGLKASVLGAAGLGGGGSAVGGLTAIGAKVAVVAVAVGGGAAITDRAVRDEEPPSRATPTTIGTVDEAVSRPAAGASGGGRAEAPEPPRSSDSSNAPRLDDQADPPRAEDDPGSPGRDKVDEPAADDGPAREPDPGWGDASPRDDEVGVKPKKGKPPSQAVKRGPAPPPKGESPPGTSPKRGGPGQGPPPGSGAPPPGDPPPSSNPPPSGNPPAREKPRPRLQLPDLNPGDDQDGLSLELPVPLIDPLGG